MHGWGQLPGGRRLQGVMPIITNHDFGFAHHGAAEPRHPEPGLSGVLLQPWRTHDGHWHKGTSILAWQAFIFFLTFRLSYWWSFLMEYFKTSDTIWAHGVCLKTGNILHLLNIYLGLCLAVVSSPNLAVSTPRVINTQLRAAYTFHMHSDLWKPPLANENGKDQRTQHTKEWQDKSGKSSVFVCFFLGSTFPGPQCVEAKQFIYWIEKCWN